MKNSRSYRLPSLITQKCKLRLLNEVVDLLHCTSFRLVILLNCYSVKDLPGVLTGAWQFSLKDMTNCGMLKSKLSSGRQPAKELSTLYKKACSMLDRSFYYDMCIFFSRIAFKFLITGCLCLVDLPEKRGFDYGKTMYQLHRQSPFKTKNLLER